MSKSDRPSAYDRKTRAREFSHRCVPTLSYVAPHAAKLHTLITLGIGIRTKPHVFFFRKRLPRGFDSHRPLHSQTTPGNAGLQDWGQSVEPMGKSWEIDAQREEVSLPHLSPHCPEIQGIFIKSNLDLTECRVTGSPGAGGRSSNPRNTAERQPELIHARAQAWISGR